MEGGGDHVDALGLTVDGGLLRVVVAVAHAGGDGDAVGFVSGDGEGECVGDGGKVIAVGAGTARGAAGRCGCEVVVVGRLVVEPGDEAGGVSAEGVLCGGVGVAVVKEADVGVGVVGVARDLVERAAVVAVEGSGGAEGGDAGGRGGEEIAGTRLGGLCVCDGGEGEGDGDEKDAEAESSED